MPDLWMVHREEYTFSQNQLGREYAKKIADVWRGEGLIVEEQETTGYINVICYEIGEAPRRACWLDDALDDLEDFPAASPWHRVEDGLPYENTNALFYDENGYFHVGSMSRFRGYTEFIDYDGNTLHGVTHWMPIEPPKE